MEAIFRFLAVNQGLIYVLLAMGGLWAGRHMFKALGEWRQAVFGLEKNIARQRFIGGLILFVLILALAVLQFVTVTFFAPSLPASAILPTPTLSILAGAPDMLLLTPPAAGEVTPASALPDAQGCDPDQLAFTSPQPGQEVSQQFMLTGIIKVPNFGFYKYEIAPLGSDKWATVSAGNVVPENGELGLLDTTLFTPGDYLLRLVVTDNEGKELPPCVIPIRVKGP
jgi:hypothetical protein